MKAFNIPSSPSVSPSSGRDPYTGDIDDDGPRKFSYAVAPPTPSGKAYVLYYHIPIRAKKIDNFQIDVPICVIFQDKKSGAVDDIYLFFNSEMNAENITLIVKLILGIETTESFELTPPIEYQSSTAGTTVESTETGLTAFIGKKFVKLTKCGEVIGRMTYCIHSGIFDDTTPLTQASTTKHEITTENQKYLKLDGKQIISYLDNPSETGFEQKVITSTRNLLDVTEYFVETENNEPTEQQREEAIEIFNKTGNIIEGFGPGETKPGIWVTRNGSKYPNYGEFKKKYTDDILSKIMEKVNHTTCGVTFDKKYPKPSHTNSLKITDSIPVTYNEKSLTRTIMSDITKSIENMFPKIELDTYGKKWWEQEEAADGHMMTNLLELLEKSKKDRVDCKISNEKYCPDYVDYSTEYQP